MQRLNNERGGVAVIVALLMVPLIGFGAIAIDVAAIHAERQQLQIGADAAALAVAQDCAHGNCGAYSVTADTLAKANVNDGAATGTVTTPSLAPSTGKVTVETDGLTEHWLAPVLGFDETAVSASATVSWGHPTGGPVVLPVVFSWCEFDEQATADGQPTGTEQTIQFTKKSNTDCIRPNGTSDGNYIPGGFGWIDAPQNCKSHAAVDTIVGSSPGSSAPSSCSANHFAKWVGRTVLLPLFDKTGAQGNNGWYHVTGFAAFTLTGYRFPGMEYNSSACQSNNNCIRGYFQEYADGSSDFDHGTDPKYDFGAAVVSLTE